MNFEAYCYICKNPVWDEDYTLDGKLLCRSCKKDMNYRGFYTAIGYKEFKDWVCIGSETIESEEDCR